MQTKSLVVEEAANELINMLCPVDFEDEDEKIEMEEDEGKVLKDTSTLKRWLLYPRK